MRYSSSGVVSSTYRLLVVDDVPDNILLMRRLLEIEGYAIEVANSGERALQKIVQNPPDLILLDIMMPDLDGYAVTHQIRKMEEVPFIPILLMTAYDQSSIVQGLDAGADDFIRKPFDVNELLARVRCLLRLKQSISERDRIAQQREDFVHRLTHDLRTPLVATDRMLKLILDETLGSVAPDMHQALDLLARSNSNLLELVNKLLQVYRFEAGARVLQFGSVHLEPLLNEVVAELMPLVQEKGLALRQCMADNLPVIEGDRLELRRVMTNLIGNSIQYTEQGTITVTLAQTQRAETTEPSQLVLFKVEDTGMGISEQQRPNLFEPFHAGRPHRSGHGLGLYLSRYIAEAHGGSITVKSQLGQGSCFTVCLPIRQPRAGI
ncbi:MAG: hybrid sensor histidine kinase/response regulator [Thermosynechococcaceae cyanobacterium]